ncbi:MAG: DUF2190 family protein [Pseudomonadota bacterium]
MRNFVQRGETITATAPTGGVASGDGVLIGKLFGVAAYSAAEGEAVELTTVGVFDLAKATGAITWGARVYWDDTNNVVTTTASGNDLIGAAIEAAASDAATARVRLNGATV